MPGSGGTRQNLLQKLDRLGYSAVKVNVWEYVFYAGQTLHVHSPCIWFLREMTSWPPSWNSDVKSKIRPRQSMRSRIYAKNIPIIHPNPIWNDGALGFFTDNKNNKEVNSDMRSVPDPKIGVCPTSEQYLTRSQSVRRWYRWCVCSAAVSWRRRRTEFCAENKRNNEGPPFAVYYSHASSHGQHRQQYGTVVINGI